MDFRNSVVGILAKSGKVLIGISPREDNDWKFPQGGIEAKESKEQAITREIKEELYINITDKNIIKSSDKYFTYYYRGSFEIRLYPFLISAEGLSDITFDKKEFSELHWLTPNEITNLPLKTRKEAYIAILKEFNLL